ncbi:MAG: hypothetical protein IPG05_00650 [Gemmatimonadetes bacterium]|nr:hypothetical protein [Gemmatimonadota bacterium]
MTRFAPSPTGELHLGHVLHAAWVWGIAEATGARVVVRMEDHDRSRCTPGFERSILEDLAWLGYTTADPSLGSLACGPRRIAKAMSPTAIRPPSTSSPRAASSTAAPAPAPTSARRGPTVNATIPAPAAASRSIAPGAPPSASSFPTRRPPSPIFASASSSSILHASTAIPFSAMRRASGPTSSAWWWTTCVTA